MKVTLVSYTQNPIDVMFLALSQCYNQAFTCEDLANTSQEKKENIIYKVLTSGHTSVSEHVSFTFLIEDVSRIVTHELVRHRLASYTQKSTRYCNPDTNEKWTIIPPNLGFEKKGIFTNVLDASKDAYYTLEEMGVKKEYSRYILPNGLSTNIVVTMNCRSLQNFFGQRLCNRAAPEIIEMAKLMAIECKKVLPIVFSECLFAEPKCIQNGGYCKEHNCCGLCPKFKRNIQIKNVEKTNDITNISLIVSGKMYTITVKLDENKSIISEHTYLISSNNEKIRLSKDELSFINTEIKKFI